MRRKPGPKKQKKQKKTPAAVFKPTAHPDEALTMVIHLGEVGSSVKGLCADIRTMLLPFTFPKLKVNNKNKLSDFTAVATQLGAKMMILLRSRLEKTTLALTKFPRGPTLYFDVARYALIGDVRQAVEETATVNKTLRTQPFLVMEGFSQSDEDEVTVSMFQGLFPEIHMGECDIQIMKRVVIASKGEDGVIAVRHYRVQKRDVHVSAAIQAIADGKIPDLSGYESVADYVLEGLQAQKHTKPKQAIHLIEIGPRIDLVFDHVETGVFGGMKLTEVEPGDEKPPPPPKQPKYRPKHAK